MNIPACQENKLNENADLAVGIRRGAVASLAETEEGCHCAGLDTTGTVHARHHLLLSLG